MSLPRRVADALPSLFVRVSLTDLWLEVRAPRTLGPRKRIYSAHLRFFQKPHVKLNTES